MKKILLLPIILALFASICYSEISTRLVFQWEYAKAVNWNAGNEFSIKGTTNFDNLVDLKYGVSEQYASYRESPFSFNHDGRRFDIGFLFYFPFDFKVGYTHSERIVFDGANNESIFLQKSIDSFVIRKEIVF